MKFITKNIDWTDAMKTYAEDVFDKHTSRFKLDSDEAEVKIAILNKKAKNIKVEIACDGFIVHEIGKDFYIAMNAAALKLKRLVSKTNKKVKAQKLKYKHQSATDNDILENISELNLTKEKIFILDPITVDCAIAAFSQTDYSFYIFKDVDFNNELAVLYKRADGSFGIIRCR